MRPRVRHRATVRARRLPPFGEGGLYCISCRALRRLVAAQRIGPDGDPQQCGWGTDEGFFRGSRVARKGVGPSACRLRLVCAPALERATNPGWLQGAINLRARVRSKPSRWWETTRTERVRPCGSGQAEERQQCRSGVDAHRICRRWGTLVSQSQERRADCSVVATRCREKSRARRGAL